jgi:hypothetical protein
MTKPRLSSSQDINDDTILDMTAEEILLNLWIEFDNNISYIRVFSIPLAEGDYGFTSDEQKDSLESIAAKVEKLYILNARIKQWMMKYHGDKFFFLEEVKDKDSQD